MNLSIPPGMTGRELRLFREGQRPKDCIVKGCRKRPRGDDLYCEDHRSGRFKLNEIKACSLCGALGHTALDCERGK